MSTNSNNRQNIINTANPSQQQRYTATANPYQTGES